MSKINDAIKLVEELEADELQHAQTTPDAPMGAPEDSLGGDTLEPSEPPVSDSAVGADTEGETALSLLRDMRNSLTQIATAVAPPETELPAEGDPEGGPAGGPAGEAGDGAPMDMPDMPSEPPTDADGGPAGEAGAEGDAEGGAEGAPDLDDGDGDDEDEKQKGVKGKE